MRSATFGSAFSLGLLLLAFLATAPRASAVAPTVLLSSPVGGEDWTGGTAHAILWSVSNSGTPVVEYWINVSSNDGASWTLFRNGTMAPTTTTQIATWVAPILNSTLMRFQLCGSDFVSVSCTTSGRFTVDSTHPVAMPSPTNGRTGVNVRATASVNFSEAMQPSPPPLNAVVFVPAVSVTALTWASPVSLAVTHADFAYATNYTWYVDCTFLDASSPGNPLSVCGSPMWLFTTAPRLPPKVALLSPVGGTDGTDWTGGSLHYIAWSVSDPDTPVVLYWINVSADNGGNWSVLQQGNVTADGSNRSLPWTTPTLNTTLMRIRVCASDFALVTCAMSLPFTVDSTPPHAAVSLGTGTGTVSLTAAVPLDFSEAMQTNMTALTTVAFTPAVAVLSLTWSTPSVLTVAHTDFAPGTDYAWTVACTLRDASSPGNSVAGCGLPLGSFRTDVPPSAVSIAVSNRSAVPDTLQIPSGRTPTFSWVFKDPDAYAVQTAFQWQVLNATTSAVVSDSGVVTSSLTTSTYHGPDLVPGVCYVLRLRLFDSIAWGPWGQLDFCLVAQAVVAPLVFTLSEAIAVSLAVVVASAAIVVIWPRGYRIPEVLAVAEAILALVLDIVLMVPSLQPLRLDLSPAYIGAAVLTVLPVVVHYLPESGSSPIDPEPGTKLATDGVLGSAMLGLGLAVPPVAPVAMLTVSAIWGLGISVVGRTKLGKPGAASAA